MPVNTILRAKPIYTMRKFKTLTIALLLISSICQAQLFNKVLSSPTSESISTVVENFQNNYYSIQGMALPPDEDRDIFLSSVQLPGNSTCVIYRFHSREDTTASWQATLYDGENFEEAVKCYKAGFRYLKQVKFKDGIQKISFDGSMQDPGEAVRFTSSILRPSVQTAIYKDFIAEIEMLNSMEGWVVHINLHSRRPDTERY